MIKAIIFDLDGVLVDTKKIHFAALNAALKKYEFKEISIDEHVKIFDGLPTNEKLKILQKRIGLPKKYFSKINNYKQKITAQILKKNIKKNSEIVKIMKSLHRKYKIAVATNAVNSTLKICLNKLGISKYIDFKLSNEDIINPKPNPEIYLRIFIKFGIYPSEALIVEDSHYGREAAISSGAKLLPIKKIEELDLKKIKLNLISKKIMDKKNVSWEDNKMNVLIPMAGAGKRFSINQFQPGLKIDHLYAVNCILCIIMYSVRKMYYMHITCYRLCIENSTFRWRLPIEILINACKM